jgi:uncharacterized membrane protein (DUF4010 family)
VDSAPHFAALGISLGLGLLVGLQRQRVNSLLAGVRTFALISVLGTASAMLAGPFGGWVVAAALLGLAAATFVGNLIRKDAQSHGITTEVAALVMFAVGALCWTGPVEVAAVIGGATALLLHAKGFLHRLAERLGDKDFRAIMQFVLLAMVILPVIPDRSIGGPPIDALNPREIWLVVVLVVGISLAGYLGFKFIGSRGSVLLSGVLGGLVSSTAASISVARRSAAAPAFVPPAAAVVMLASTVVYARLLIEVFAVAPAHWGVIAPPIAAIMAASAVLSLAVWARARVGVDPLPEPENPTELRSALLFGLLYALVLVAVTAAKGAVGDTGLYAIAALSGLTDMDAITLSLARMASDGQLDSGTATRAILVAAIANYGFKFIAVATLGGARLGAIVGGLFFIMSAACAAAIALWPV